MSNNFNVKDMKIKSLSIILLLTVMALPACGSGKGGEEAKMGSILNSAEAASKSKVKTIKLTKDEFLKLVVNFEESPNEWKYLGDKPAIVDFYADWCGPCKRVAPILEELAEEYADKIVIYKVNTENEEELAAAFGISSIPSLLFVPMEGKPQMAIGGMGKADFKKAIDTVLLKK